MFSNNKVNKKDDFVWAFKYKPAKFDELILLERMKRRFQDIINKRQIPDLLLYGPPGLGKTSLVNVLKNECDLDVLYLNGSIDNSIDDVRGSIKTFTKKSSIKQKVVFIDEFQRYDKQVTQPALNAEIEHCQKTSFIFVTNHVDKIIEPLISRCGGGISFFYNQEEMKELRMKYLNRCFYILDEENVEYDKKAVAKVVQRRFPDMRNTIHDLQSLYNQYEKIDLKSVETLTVNLKEIFDLIRNRNFDKIRYYVANMNHDDSSIYKSILNKVEDYVESSDISKVIDLCYEHSKTSAMTNDPQIPLTHFFVSMFGISLK